MSSEKVITLMPSVVRQFYYISWTQQSANTTLLFILPTAAISDFSSVRVREGNEVGRAFEARNPDLFISGGCASLGGSLLEGPLPSQLNV